MYSSTVQLYSAIVGTLCMKITAVKLTTSKVGGGDTGKAGRSASSPYLAGYSSAQEARSRGQDATTAKNAQSRKRLDEQ